MPHATVSGGAATITQCTGLVLWECVCFLTSRIAGLYRTILIRPKTRFATAAPNDMYSLSKLVGKHTCTHTHTHTHTHNCVGRCIPCVRTVARPDKRADTHTRACASTSTYTHAHIDTYTHTHKNAYIQMHTYRCAYMSMHLHVYTRTLTSCVHAQSGSAGCGQRRVTIVWLSENHTTRCCFRCGAVTNPARLQSGPSVRYVCVLDFQRALNSYASILELCSRLSAIWGFPCPPAPLELDRRPKHREKACLSTMGLDVICWAESHRPHAADAAVEW